MATTNPASAADATPDLGGARSSHARRMVLVDRAELRELAALARVAVELHNYVTHYGKDECCDLVDKWRSRLKGHADPVTLLGVGRVS